MLHAAQADVPAVHADVPLVRLAAGREFTRDVPVRRDGQGGDVLGGGQRAVHPAVQHEVRAELAVPRGTVRQSEAQGLFDLPAQRGVVGRLRERQRAVGGQLRLEGMDGGHQTQLFAAFGFTHGAPSLLA